MIPAPLRAAAAPRRGTSIRMALALAALITAVAVPAASAQVGGDGAADRRLAGPVEIGGLFPLTGDLGFLGSQEMAAAELAVADFNGYLNRTGAGWWLVLHAEDTATNPEVAVERIRALHALGVDTIVGSMTSDSLQRIKDYTDQNGMLVAACCSSAQSLAIPGDSIYRFTVSDSGQGAGLARILESDGKEAVVSIWRGDAYGDGVWTTVASEFEARGGTAYAGIRYPPDNAGFVLDTALLDKNVRTAVERYGADKVAVLMISFDESVEIVRAASARDSLSGVEWLASGASVPYVERFAGDEATSSFIAQVNLTSIDTAFIRGDLYGYVNEALGEEPDSNYNTATHLVYDTVRMVGESMLAADSAEPSRIKEALPAVASDYEGATRFAGLNGAGDLASTTYRILSIQNGSWADAGRYVPERDLLAAAEQPVGEVDIGVLLPISTSAHGTENLAATRLGAEDFNEFLAGMDADWRMSLVVEDTLTDPAVALEMAQEMHRRGIDVIIGPGISGSARAILPYADASGMVMLSCCSTAPSLAVPDDGLLRLAPDDSNLGVAMGKLLEREGISALVPIWRGDSYGDGLHGAVSENFAGLRGGVMGEGIRYSPGHADFSGEVSSLAAEVSALADEHGADRVAVLMISFGESAEIAGTASAHETLSGVRWFGSDTLVGRPQLSEGILAEWAEQVGLTAMQLAESGGPLHERVRSHMLDRFGQATNSYVYPSYDTAWLVGLSVLQAGSAEGAAIRSALGEVAGGYRGAMNRIILNEAGDLASADYSIWRAAGGGWVETGRYFLLDDTITANVPP